MKPSRLFNIALVLVFVLLGVTALAGKDDGKSRVLQRPDGGQARDPGPTDGDPWQDDEGGGVNFTSGGQTHIVILPGISVPFQSFRVVFVKVYLPCWKPSKEVQNQRKTSIGETK